MSKVQVFYYHSCSATNCRALGKGVWRAHWLCGYCWKFQVNLFIKLLSRKDTLGLGHFELAAV